MNRTLKYILYGLACIVLSGAIGFGAYAVASGTKTTAKSTPCVLNANSDHAMMVKIYSPTAQDICAKIADRSNGLWNIAFVEPHGVVVCSVKLGNALYNVYDLGLAAGANIARLYTTTVVCPILKNDRRLLGQGY